MNISDKARRCHGSREVVIPGVSSIWPIDCRGCLDCLTVWVSPSLAGWYYVETGDAVADRAAIAAQPDAVRLMWGKESA